jgi:allantoicase
MTELQQVSENYINLALPGNGAAICSVSDDFFAPAKRMLSAEEPVFIPDRFDAHGKWMDGWESRRKRIAGHDHCIVRICPGVIHGIEINTRHFTGNFPPAASVEACHVAVEPTEGTQWTELVPRTDLQGDSSHAFTIRHEDSWTHLRLNIFPDGGVARFRVYGEPDIAPGVEGQRQFTDLSSADVGGRAIECNNMHFGHMRNLLSTSAVANMGDGWETRRRREPGNDWVILKLGHPGTIGRIELDTAFFRGNYPARCSLKGGNPKSEDGIAESSAEWAEILPEVSLGPDQLHIFESQLLAVGDVNYVRLEIVPDGGVARLRLLGVPA